MNEELKIIISAVTDAAKKNIQGVKKELEGIGGAGKSAGSAIGKALKTAAVAAGAVIGAIIAVGAALVSLGKNTRQFREEQARLNAAFAAAGGSAETAAQAYNGLFRFMGDSDTASEAAAHLAKLTTNEQELAEWTTALQGVYATFGKSLPIEGLTEAANETAKVGKVTGGLADALNWAGVSEDAFNASLATANSEQERQALIRNTLNGLYSDAAKLYEKNNADIIAANEAQARLDSTTAKLGKTVQPLLTALTNLSATLLSALAPAIQVVSNALTALVNAVIRAANWIKQFFSFLSGKGASTNAITETAASLGSVSTGLGGASAGASNLGGNLEGAAKSAEKLKKATAGFDELNKLPSESSSGSAASGGAGGGIGAGAGMAGGFALDTSGLTDALDGTAAKFDGFAEKIREKISQLKDVFAPTIDAFKQFGSTIGQSVQEALPSFTAGLEGFKTGFGSLGSYILEQFIPNVVNSWTTNLLPFIGDTTGFTISELGKTFETLGDTFQQAVETIIKPALETFEKITTDTLDGLGKGWKKHGDDLLGNLTTAFDGIRESWNTFYKELIEPVAKTVLDWVNEIWDESLKPLWDNLVDAVLDISNNLTILWNTILKPIVDWVLQKIYPVVKQVIDNCLAVLKTLLSSASGILSGVITSIKGVIQFITGVFTGDWRKAWDGIKNIVSGVWQTIWSSIKGIINLIIDGINRFWSGIYQAVKGIVDTLGDVAGVIGDLLGKSWRFSMPSKPPLIPKLAKGGIVTAETLATIGEGGKKEAVLPLEQNTEWMDKLADKIASRNSTPAKIVLQLDGKELGWATIDNLNSITEQVGYLPLKY